MPGPATEWHELHETTVTAYQRMCRYLHSCDLGEIGVSIRRQAIREKLLYERTAEFAGRQADAVYDDQLGLATGGSLVLIRRGTLHRRDDEACLGIDRETGARFSIVDHPARA